MSKFRVIQTMQRRSFCVNDKINVRHVMNVEQLASKISPCLHEQTFEMRQKEMIYSATRWWTHQVECDIGFILDLIFTHGFGFPADFKAYIQCFILMNRSRRTVLFSSGNNEQVKQ